MGSHKLVGRSAGEVCPVCEIHVAAELRFFLLRVLSDGETNLSVTVAMTGFGPVLERCSSKSAGEECHS